MVYYLLCFHIFALSMMFDALFRNISALFHAICEGNAQGRPGKPQGSSVFCAFLHGCMDGPTRVFCYLSKTSSVYF